MSIDWTHPYVVVLLMALVTLATRWGGVFVMSFVPISPPVERFIKAMSASVLVALLAPLFLTGGPATQAAMLATGVLMVVVKKPIVAITAGILVAAIWRQFL